MVWQLRFQFKFLFKPLDLKCGVHATDTVGIEVERAVVVEELAVETRGDDRNDAADSEPDDDELAAAFVSNRRAQHATFDPEASQVIL